MAEFPWKVTETTTTVDPIVGEEVSTVKKAQEEKIRLVTKEKVDKANTYLSGWKTGIAGGKCNGREEKKEFLDGYIAGIKYFRKQVAKTRKAFGLPNEG